MAGRAEKNTPTGPLVKRALHQFLAGLGYRVERRRDPYRDAARLAGAIGIDLAIDGGAYRGNATRRLLEVCPRARVLAFEPMPAFAERLRQDFAGDSRVSIMQQALSDEAGPATLHVHRTPFTSSLHNVSETTTYMEVDGDVEVERVRLDDVIDASGSGAVLVKLDLQGHERSALRGAAAALADGRIRALVVEVNFVRRYAEGSSFSDLVAALGATGFGLHRLYDLRLTGGDAYEIGDALFVRDPDRASLGSVPATSYVS